MSLYRNKIIFHAVFLLVLVVGLYGCGVKQDSSTSHLQKLSGQDVQRFELQLDKLVNQVVATQVGSIGEFAPVAVIPGAIKHGSPYTHLEEVIADALKNKLQATNELYVFTSQNWFEYREGRPLTFWKNPAREREFLRQLKIFEVRINPEPLFAKVKVEVVVSDARGHLLQGQRAQQTFDFSSSSPAAQLNAQEVNRTPFPEGIEERPFTSIDRFAFSLVADLTDTYRAGVLTSGRHASEEDVQVVLAVSPTIVVPKRTIDSIVKSLQHAIVRAKGVTCVLAPQDGSVKESEVQRGTVLLVVDFDRLSSSEMISVAMRGVWQVSPLETASGSIVDANLTGTYLAGFTAKGYLLLQGRGGKGQADAPGDRYAHQEMTLCFYGADSGLQDNSYKALRHVPGLSQLTWLECQGVDCSCFQMIYAKPVDVLAGWLRRYLPHYTDELSFTVRPTSRESIDVLYNTDDE